MALDEEFRTVIEDIRVRQAALVTLIYATDTQALSLLRLFTTLAVATASGTVAAIASGSKYSLALFTAFGTSTAILVAGVFLCLSALEAARISLPGRKTDFWQWAVKHKIKKSKILDAYLLDAETQYKSNQKLNRETATTLKWAKRCAAAAPILALLAGAAVSLIKL